MALSQWRTGGSPVHAAQSKDLLRSHPEFVEGSIFLNAFRLFVQTKKGLSHKNMRKSREKTVQFRIFNIMGFAFFRLFPPA